MSNNNLPPGCTQTEIDQHLDGGEPVKVDEERAIELAFERLNRSYERVLNFGPEAVADQDFPIDADNRVTVKFEFEVIVDYAPSVRPTVLKRR